MLNFPLFCHQLAPSLFHPYQCHLALARTSILDAAARSQTILVLPEDMKNVLVMPSLHTLNGGILVMSLPLNMMEPESGRYIPLMRFNRVDFPAPLGPTRPTISP